MPSEKEATLQLYCKRIQELQDEHKEKVGQLKKLAAEVKDIKIRRNAVMSLHGQLVRTKNNG
jgi:hypothetical protein